MRSQWLLNSGIQARFIDSEAIFFCLPRIERSGDKSYRTFEFRLFRIPDAELVPYGTVRVEAYNYLGWDVSPSGEYFVLGAVGIPFELGKKPPRPTIIWRRKTTASSNEVPQWEQFSHLPEGYDPVFSPDGMRLAVNERGSWTMNFEDLNRACPEPATRFSPGS